MARTLVFVAAQTQQWGSAPAIPVEEIPQDVIDDVEETYKGLKANPQGRIRATFDDPAEMALFVRQVVSYCAQRTIDGVPAPIRFRKSPSKGLTKQQMDYRITDLKTESETATEEIREATANANGNAGPAIDEATKTAVAEALPKKTAPRNGK